MCPSQAVLPTSPQPRPFKYLQSYLTVRSWRDYRRRVAGRTSKKRGRIKVMPRAIAAFLLSAMIALSAALVRTNGPRLTALYASPDGTDNGVCSQSMPCTAQSVLNACPVGGLCSLNLADGLYLDPAMNFYYHRTVGLPATAATPVPSNFARQFLERSSFGYRTTPS
jgi:hypothetical protein